ncbi:AfsR/SARP family transcriptional regulator [Kribbella sp. NPDC051587]|uniref:AfsR/SARP family transcriptional regulator n=1 Tax=Kribbella sp. NPDC051587 TaxID=3364119 RepID=UPI0037AB39BC
MTAPLRVDLLGPLVVRRGETSYEPGPLRQQALFAVLALQANRVCTAEELFDAVWADKPPASGLRVLPSYIYRLRKVLPLKGLLETTREGYILRLPEEVTDVGRFDAAVRTAVARQKEGDTAAAAASYTEALELFRGEPLSGLPGHYLAVHRQRLVERRYKVLSDRIELDLAGGRHADITPELVAVVAERPLDERLAGQLMLALYAGGRQAEAQAVYTSTRDTLVDQLGVEPGPELRATHQRILRNESTASTTKDELPYQDAAFVGRDRELAAIVAALTPAERSAPPVVAVAGMGGVGKTALAIRAAREAADVYPDGLLYLQLHGHTPGREPLATQAALDHLLSSIGVNPERIPRDLDSQAALWRSEVAGRRLLIVLDDTPSSRLILPLLPGASTCGVLVTSRRQLTGLDTPEQFSLDVLDPADAARLLADVIGAARAAEVPEATRELLERCGQMPLAIRIAGARLRHRPAWTVEHLNQRLQAQDRRLDELSIDGRGVRSTFAMSYEQLSPEQQTMFRRLSLLPGRDLDRYGAGALADVDPLDAGLVLEDLFDANLLLQPAADRFQFHDLLRQYATELSQQTDPEPERRAALERLLEYYLQTADRASLLLTKAKFIRLGDRPRVDGPELATSKEGLLWGDRESGNIFAALQRVADGSADEWSWLLAGVFARHFHERNQVHQRDALLELGLAAARRLGNHEAEARLRWRMANFIKVQEGPLRSIELVREALDLMPDDGDAVLRVELLDGLAQLLRLVDPGDEAIAAHTAALELAEAIGDRRMLTYATMELAITQGARHEHQEALESYQRALTMARTNDDRSLQPHLLNGIAESCNGLGRPDEAIEAVTESQRIAEEIGMRYSQMDSLCQLGAAYCLLGDYDRSIEILQRSLNISLEIADVYGIDEARLQLGRTYLAAGRLADSRSQFGAVVASAQDSHRARIAALGLDGLAACAEAEGTDDEAAALLDEALDRLGPMTPLHAADLRRRRAAIDGSD